MKKILVIITLLIFIALTACANETVTPQATAFWTPSATLIPSASPTETSTPKPEFDYSVISLDDKATWNVEFKTKIEGSDVTINPAEYYSGLKDRVVADAGSALEAQYKKEDQAFHVFITHSVMEFLKSQGVDTPTYTDQQLADYKNSIGIYNSYWDQLLKNYQKSGEYKLSVVDPWLLRGDGVKNLGMYSQENAVFNTSESGGYTLDNLSISKIMEYYKIDASTPEGLKKWQDMMKGKINGEKATSWGAIESASTDKIPLFGIKNTRFWIPDSFSGRFNLAAIMESPFSEEGGAIMIGKLGEGKFRPFFAGVENKIPVDLGTFTYNALPFQTLEERGITGNQWFYPIINQAEERASWGDIFNLIGRDIITTWLGQVKPEGNKNGFIMLYPHGLESFFIVESSDGSLPPFTLPKDR
jgi:hypothetical protein